MQDHMNDRNSVLSARNAGDGGSPMTDEGYVPLTDEQVEAIAGYARRKNVRRDVPAAYMEALLADREHYKRRAEAAEQWRKDHNCPMPITRGFEWTKEHG